MACSGEDVPRSVVVAFIQSLFPNLRLIIRTNTAYPVPPSDILGEIWVVNADTDELLLHYPDARFGEKAEGNHGFMKAFPKRKEISALITFSESLHPDFKRRLRENMLIQLSLEDMEERKRKSLFDQLEWFGDWLGL